MREEHFLLLLLAVEQHSAKNWSCITLLFIPFLFLLGFLPGK